MPYGFGYASMIGAQVLFFIITIALIFWFVKNNSSKGNDSVKKILKRRLVSGEINGKEYDFLLNKIQKEE